MASEITHDYITLDFWATNTLKCEQFISCERNWQSVPLFNYMLPENVKDQQLVRFQGMIQNMFNPEFFLCKYEVKSCTTGQSRVCSGKWKDSATCREDEKFIENSEYNESDERQTWLGAPVPALNDWVETSWKKQHLKRQCPVSEEEVPNPAKKVMGSAQPLVQAMSTSESPHVLCDLSSKKCYLKLYDVDTTSYALNDVVEVVGFLSVFQDMDEEFVEFADTPVLKIPQIHVVACKKLCDSNSLLPNFSLDAGCSTIASIRQDLLLVLTQLLLGDALAAEYLLCHFLSSIYQRTDMMALGQFSLNIMNIPRNYSVKNIYSILETLVVKSVFLPLSLKNFNNMTLIPKKNYENDQLAEGLLQLSHHTHLVLDETQMQAGKLENKGVYNMAALRKLILEQKVPYDFQYYSLDFNCDVPVLIFSEGKSLLPCSVVIPLQPDSSCLETVEEIFQAARHFLQPALLNSIRAYIISLQSSSFMIDSDVQELIQEDFVALRQDKERNTSPDDLHNLMVLARLVSLSNGEKNLSTETWKHILDLEKQRKERLNLAVTNRL